MMKKPLVILTGPTAVGKTKLSIALAKEINGEIISADSIQVYRGMDIGSAKVTTQEMQGVAHYLIDVLNPDEEFHVVKFQEMAKAAMQEIYAKGKIPILVGGTGFYIQALLYDIDFTQTEADVEYRKELEQIAKEQGNDVLHAMLQEKDPVSAQKIHPNNVKRVIRALEYYKESQSTISEHNEKERQKVSPYQSAYFVLTMDRAKLYQRIEERIEQMLKEGLVEEVQSLYRAGYSADLVSMQGLGYKELLEWIEGKCSFEEAIYRLKRDTRHFAKRQLTWFRREREVLWIDKDQYQDEHEILEEILTILKKRGIIEC
jgi:tRNA dimethylallyltransferase